MDLLVELLFGYSFPGGFLLVVDEVCSGVCWFQTVCCWVDCGGGYLLVGVFGLGFALLGWYEVVWLCGCDCGGLFMLL